MKPPKSHNKTEDLYSDDAVLAERRKKQMHDYLLKEKEERKRKIPLLQSVNFHLQITQCFKMHIDKTPVLLDDRLSIASRNAALFCDGRYVYMYGGKGSQDAFNSLLILDTSENHWYRLPNYTLDDTCHQLPTLKNPFLFQFESGLILFDGVDEFFVLQYATKFWDSHKRDPEYWSGVCWFRIHASTRQTPMEHASLCSIGNSVYLFGGSYHNISSNRLSMFTLGYQTSINADDLSDRYEYEQIICEAKEIIPSKCLDCVPAPRSHHGSTVIGKYMYIFGGIKESDQPEQITVYNDIYRFDSETNEWEEIKCECALPPPMYGFSMNGFNNYIYIYGGIAEDTQIQSSVYRFDIEAKKWTVIQIKGHVPSSLSPTELQDSSAHHSATLVNFKKLAIVGGVKANLHGRREVYKKRFFYLDDIFDAGEEVHIDEYFWKLVTQKLYYDLVLRSNDRSTGQLRQLTVHRAILAIRSPYFEQALKEFDPAEFNDEGIPILDISGFHSDTVESYMQFIYSGNLRVDGAEQIQDLLRCSQHWGHYDIIEEICGSDRHLSLSTKVMNQITADYQRLFQESLQIVDKQAVGNLSQYDLLVEKNKDGHHRYTDVCVQIIDENEEPIFKIACHKFMLCRSPHIANVFNSGMDESTTNNIQFDNFSGKNGFMSILKYLYTGEIQISAAVAIEVLNAAQILVLPVLISSSTAIIAENINSRNVFQVLDIADTYHHHELKRRCLHLLKQNVHDIRNHPDYHMLNDELRKDLELHLIPYQIKLELKKEKKQQKAHRKK